MVLIKHRMLFGAKVTSDYSDDANISEETCGDRKVRGRASQHLFAFTKWRFDRIERDGTNNE
jgi:hypothetical protein